MFFAGSRSHAIPLFISANVLPRNMFYFETVFLLWTTDLPILHLRTSVISSPIYPMFIYITPTSFPGSLLFPSLEREKPFNNKIYQFLFAVPGDEDDYVEVSKLILNWNY